MSGTGSQGGEDRAAAVPRSALGAAAALALLLVLLATVAAASGGGVPLRRGDGTRPPSQVFVDYAYTILIVLAIGFVAGFALLLRSARGGRVGRAHISGRTMLLSWALILVFVAAYRLVREPEAAPNTEPIVRIPELGTPTVRPRQDGQRAGPEFRWEVALIAAAGAALAAFAYARRRRPVEEEPGPDEAAAAVSAVLDEALDDLRAERDARRAVIAAYARLEATLAYHGLPRRAAEAPLEYLSRILLELEVTPEAVLDLTQLFQQAKFSRRRIDAAMKDEAIDALAAVRDDLRVAA
ncbi:MAG: DUF4129 domain-containing protein [Thermoleophilia bacterium]|nr:DUF4129 domain-containing protein [Thermoleophilia bacterium]